MTVGNLPENIDSAIVSCQWLAKNHDPITAYCFLSGLLKEKLERNQEAKVRFIMASILRLHCENDKEAMEQLDKAVSLFSFVVHSCSNSKIYSLIPEQF